VAFVSHGAPLVALEDGPYQQALRALGERFRHAKAVLSVSAHALAAPPVRVGTAPTNRTVHDFGGFPDALHAMTYPAPGDPDLAAEIVELLDAEGFEAATAPGLGLDHGVWIPMRLALPDATLPVIPMTLPSASPGDLLALGTAMSPVRDRGVAVLASGGIVHNLRRVVLDDRDAPVEAWAGVFDRWVADRIAAKDTIALAAYRRRAPHAVDAAPTPEHFDPLFVALGAAEADNPRTLYEGFEYGTLSMRCVIWG